MFENDHRTHHFNQPDIFREKGELERVAKKFGIDSSVLLYQAQQGNMRTLNETDWCTLDNTDSYYIESGDWETVASHAQEQEIVRDWESIKTALETGTQLDAPIIMKIGDQTHLVSGNTRLMVSRALGIKPQVWVFEVDAGGENT